MNGSIRKWMKQNTFKVHLIAFLLMIIPAGLLYPAAENPDSGWVWFFLGLVISGNILVVMVR